MLLFGPPLGIDGAHRADDLVAYVAHGADERLVLDAKTDLFARIPHGTGQTVLREALLLADHNSYHVGQLVLLRRLLGVYKG